MGKGAAAEMRKQKKKGRPSLLDLQKRNLKQQQQQQQQLDKLQHQQQNPNRRSTRQNPATDTDGGGGGSGDDDEDERQEKKVKLVVRLPPSNQHFPQQRRSSANSLSLNSASQGSDSITDGENHEMNATSHRSADLAPAHQFEKVEKATDTVHGSMLDSGPTTPLPDKKLLVFILDRLQKKDTHGVFSEPVDPNELPDYHEIIEHPMDFQTVRKKLDRGCYSSSEEFEADVFLICSNAMEYNASDTVYFRQARSIQELAKRDFENLRQVNDDGEPQPKIVRRGRPPSKNLKSSISSSPVERVGPECSSDATLATGGDNVVGSNSYNLRRGGAISSRFQSNDALFRASNQSRNNETYGGNWSSDWNSEFPASILKAEAKYGNKHFSLDENRRATYRQSHSSAFGHEPSVLTLSGDMKRLMGVGLHSEHGYARSLARFAASMGPTVWKIASEKIKNVLPAGLEFGPGWVEVNEASPWPTSASPEQKKSSNNSVHDGLVNMSVSGVNSVVTCGSSLPCKEDMVEAVCGQKPNDDSAVFRSGVGGPSFQTWQKHMLNPGRNGFNGVSGYDLSSQMVSISNAMLTSPTVANQIVISETKVPGSSRSTPCENISTPGTPHWQGISSHHRQYSIPVPPDLNVRFQSPTSPNSSLRVGSPQQPDLALQL